jgi:hypothetical protein
MEVPEPNGRRGRPIGRESGTRAVRRCDSRPRISHELQTGRARVIHFVEPVRLGERERRSFQHAVSSAAEPCSIAGRGQAVYAPNDATDPVGCTLSIWINDSLVTPGMSVGGVKLSGYGLGPNHAEATFTVESSDPHVTIYFSIRCPGPPMRTTDVPHDIGGGWQPPREGPDNPDRGRQVPERPDKDFAGPDSQHR